MEEPVVLDSDRVCLNSSLHRDNGDDSRTRRSGDKGILKDFRKEPECSGKSEDADTKPETYSPHPCNIDVGASCEQMEHHLAMIPYEGKVMYDIVNQMGGLGLKRHAEEDWESGLLKKRKMEAVSPREKPIIMTYAANLRKTKAKLKRNVKRKKLEDKENITMDDAEQDAEMEVLEADSSVNSSFTFKARGRRRLKYADKGCGGWPSPATQGS
ncbi:hypothetical protein K1719_025154 [Acacia pycnantha]|nr:hypothetical protein K1719_025154 [Acacia pycnantha]